MSIQIMNAVWRYSQSTGRTKLTLLAIADHQGEQGAWPSLGTLAKMVGASERSVQRDIEELEKLGELRVTRYGSPTKSRNKTNLYFITLDDTTDSRVVSDDMTNQAHDVTNQSDDVTPVVVQTLNRNLNKTEGKDDIYKPSKQLVNELSEKYPGLDLKECWESMMDYCSANGKTYKNWDAAYRNWVRKEWSWSDKGKQQTNREETRQYLDKSVQQTQEMLSEYAEAEKNAAPPPKCKHDKTLALCPICVREL